MHRIALSLCVIISSCTQVPDRMSARTPIETGDAFTLAATGPVESAWWRSFNDPALTALVEQALKQNPVLTGADFSVAEAEALVRLADLSRAPSTATRAGLTAARAPGNDDTDVRADPSLSASWEWDAAGRLKALLAAAEADANAARETRRDVAVTIASETALAYINLRGAEARLSVGARNRAAQEKSLELVKSLFANGRATQLDVERAEAQYRTTLAALPAFEADRDAAENRLAALTGQSATRAVAISAAPLPTLNGPLLTGAPEDLIRRRPDIRAAEADLAAELALSEAARADLFPRIIFNANLLSLFTDGPGGLSGDRLGFALGPAISWAGPDLRRVRARISAADARAGRFAANYESAVLDALADVETALSAYALERQRTDNLEKSAAAAANALRLAEMRYTAGLDSFLAVLDAQRTLNDAEDRLVVNRTESARRAVRAYRSLGGIWTDADLTDFRTTETAP